MRKIKQQRLAYLGMLVLIAAAIVGLIAFALKQNINLFFAPSEIANAKLGKMIRVGGMVKVDSVRRDPNSLNVKFIITDFKDDILVNYSGILPDLFREKQGVVVRGVLNANGQFDAVEVLAKHDENYMPPMLAKTLENNSKQ